MSEWEVTTATTNPDGTMTVNWQEGQRTAICARELIDTMVESHNERVLNDSKVREEIALLNDEMATHFEAMALGFGKAGHDQMELEHLRYASAYRHAARIARKQS